MINGQTFEKSIHMKLKLLIALFSISATTLAQPNEVDILIKRKREIEEKIEANMN